MAKQTKPASSERTNHPEIVYSNFPSDGTCRAKSVEWGKGEGIDIILGTTTIELTHTEYAALVAAEEIRKLNMLLD
jgi:hypothetical protein